MSKEDWKKKQLPKMKIIKRLEFWDKLYTRMLKDGWKPIYTSKKK